MISSIPPFCNIAVENVLLTLKQLKVSKITGLDKIPAKMLNIASDIIAPSLTFIYNLSLSTGIFVDEWKNARVIPIYKNEDRFEMGTYRPISILPIVSKIFEKEVFRQFNFHLNENSLLSKFQSGFRPCHSTISALIQMCDAWFDKMVEENYREWFSLTSVRRFTLLIMRSCLRCWNYMVQIIFYHSISTMFCKRFPLHTK